LFFVLIFFCSRRTFAADAKAPAAAAGGAKAGGAKAGGGKPTPGAKGAKKKPEPALEFKEVIKYGHGADDRPLRRTVRDTERRARLEALAAAGALPKELAGSNVVAADPVLRAVAHRESAKLADPLDPVSAKEGEPLAQLEEPEELAILALTRSEGKAFEPGMPEEFRGRIALVPSTYRDDVATDVSDNEGAGGSGGGGGDGGSSSSSSFARSVPVLPSLPYAAESDAQASEMAASLLKDFGAQQQSKLSQAISSLLPLDAAGQPIPPLEAAGLRDPRSRRGAEWYRRYTHGLAEQSDDESRADRAAFRDASEGRVFTRPTGSDPANLPEGILNEFATPYDLYGHEAEVIASEVETERELAMTAEERAINDERKKLRDIVEKPVPIATRPLWPLYGLLAGVDQVQQVTSGGMIASSRTMVVVGNNMGGVGFGMATHKEPFAATKAALLSAQRDMIHVATDRGSLYHDLIGKKNNVYVIIRALPSSSQALSAAPIIHDIFDLAGIKRASAKIVGSHRRSNYTIVQALFDAFHHHYPPQRDAAMRGLRLTRTAADRVEPKTIYPFNSRGPRFPPANDRFTSGKLRP
jgi:small subunit ribosomal protein S5